jgi:hypothetical protein
LRLMGFGEKELSWMTLARSFGEIVRVVTDTYVAAASMPIPVLPCPIGDFEVAYRV